MKKKEILFLKMSHSVPKDREMEEMLDEYAKNGEECKPMKFIGDDSSVLYAIVDRDTKDLVGVMRMTEELRKKCHGNLGISIRPSMRGEGYGGNAVRGVFASPYGHITACVDSANDPSLRMFTKLGWKRTGVVYEWSGDRTAIEFLHPNCNA